MGKHQLTRADVLVYFTGSPARQTEPALQDIEKIELFKTFGEHVAEERKRELVGLIETMCMLPSYAHANDAARHFGYKWFFSRITFGARLLEDVENGLLTNPVSSVFGLSPKLLLQIGLLDEFLGKPHQAEDIWDWVRQTIRATEDTHVALKAIGFTFAKEV